MENFEKLEKSIGYTFKNKDLLKKALTHRSYAYENKIAGSCGKEENMKKKVVVTRN